MINLEDHKVYVASHKMDMVPYSIAIEALQQVANVDIEKYTSELEQAMSALNNSLNDIKLDD